MIDLRLPRVGRFHLERLDAAPGAAFAWHASLTAPSGKTLGVARKTLAGTLAELAVAAPSLYRTARVVLWGARLDVDLVVGSPADRERAARLASIARTRRAYVNLAGHVDGIVATFGVNVAKQTRSFRRLDRALQAAQRPPHER